MFVDALDPFYLGVTALFTVGWQALGFAIAFGLQIDTITDCWSALNFLALALLSLNLGAEYQARNIVVTLFVAVWAVRLGAWQLFRMIKLGGDTRFDDMRAKFWSYLQFWLAQALWVWVVCMPAVVLNSPAVSRTTDGYGGAHVNFGTAEDIIGVIFFAVGFTWEALADLQKYRFKTVMRPPRGAITDVSVWRYSRRPNYFGEILLWLGVYLASISPATHSSSISARGRSALLGTAVSPIFTFLLLMFLSGVPLAEKPTQERYFLMSHGPSKRRTSSASGADDAEEADGGTGERLAPYGDQVETDPWQRMKAFRERTSLLFPIPPSVYRPLPRWLKSTLLLDFPFYNFDETKDGPAAIAKAKARAVSDAA